MGIKKNNKIKIFCKQKRPLVCLTAYNKHMATIVDPFCDLVLVGDSLAMVLYGETNTNNASLQTMIEHGKSVVKGCAKSIVIVDMPKGTYESYWTSATTSNGSEKLQGKGKVVGRT